MKNKVCVVLVLALIFLCASCGGEENSASSEQSASSTKSKVAELAEKGEIDGCKYKLGESIDKIFDDYNLDESGKYKDESQVDVDNYVNVSGTDTVKIDTGTARYYYKSDMRDKGVAFIVNFDRSYGFGVGYAELKDIRNDIELTPDSEKLVYNAEDKSGELPWFYYSGSSESVYMISYNFDKYILSFYFENNKLSATTIYDSTIWN